MNEAEIMLLKLLEERGQDIKENLEERQEIEKVIEAMEVIKTFCSKHKGYDKCKKCPLGNQKSGECVLKTWASHWNVKIVNKLVLV